MANGFLIFFPLFLQFPLAVYTPLPVIATGRLRRCLWLFCSLAISHSVTMSFTLLSDPSIAVKEERICSRCHLF